MTAHVARRHRGTSNAPSPVGRLRSAMHFDRGTPAHAETGLGLPFCKMAVEQMGGAIWVESSEGRGATFSFTLPKPAVRRT